MDATLFKDTRCELGEGPLWDGEALWFFDILAPAMFRLSADGATLESWEGDRMASAMARTDGDAMLIATEADLMLFDLAAQSAETLCPLEADDPGTRSNDGRADRQGGFWIGTMGKRAEHEAGAIYRWYRGELRCLRRGVTIPNSICFSPDGRVAYFSDTALGTMYRWRLDAEGWPVGAPEVFYRAERAGEAPDGAVTDESGAVWVAIWGGGRVQRIGSDGAARDMVRLPVPQPSCPALTPEGLMFITTGREGMDAPALETAPHSGGIFSAQLAIGALPEPRVVLR